MISVVVPVHNGMPWLEDQLVALVAQQCPEPWEVVIADNGSTDRSAAFARDWADDHENFRLVDASTVEGAPAARNAGVQAAAGELLVFCDADDVVQPGWLASFAKALDEVDVVAGVFDFWSLNGLRTSPDQPASMRQLGFLPAGLGANLAVRRQAFEAVGGFAEELLVGEDIDLCWRLQLAGYRFVIDFDAGWPSVSVPSSGWSFDRPPPTGGAGRRSTAATGRPAPGGTCAGRSSHGCGSSSPPRASSGRVAIASTGPGPPACGSGRLAGSLREGVFFP